MKLLIRAVPGFCAALVVATPALAQCSLTKVAQMPLVELGAHYAVTAKIDGQVRPLIVDTGSEVSLIKSSVAKELDLKPDHSISDSRPVVGVGQTQADLYVNVVLPVLAFGDLVYRDRSTVVAAMDDGKTPEADSAGLLGDDILSQFEVEFDFPSGKLTFYRSSGCYKTFLPWTGAYSAIPFDHRNAKIAIDIFLNGERTRAIVDTGNNFSFVSKHSNALWGVPYSAFVNTPAQSRSPLNDGKPMPVQAYMFDTVKIGDELSYQRKMGVVDVDFPLASANLGLDYWKDRKVWISYANGWMFVSDKPQAAALAYPVIEAPPAAAGDKAKSALSEN
ncbi:MAG: retropepsin-like aspartic protease [Roseiarcus sp.]